MSSMRQALRGRLRALVRDRRGVAAVIFALALLPLVLAVGVAIDAGRAYLVKQRLSYALDAAGLAVGSSTGTIAERQAIFQSFFFANYPSDAIGQDITPTVTIGTSIITTNATANVPTTFMRIVGLNSIDVASSGEVILRTTGLEVALVMDNTGSMASGGKITQLIESSNELIDILFGAEENPTQLKVSVIPFVTTVNIGPSMGAFVSDELTADFAPDTWKGCVKARAFPNDTQDTSTAVGGQWSVYRWPKEGFALFDFPGFASFCRNAWTTTIDTTPSFTFGPNQACPDPLTPLTNNQTTVRNAIDAMVPWSGNGTMIHLGMIWGLRALSPEPPFTEGGPFNSPDVNKAMIVLTDGQNFISSQGFRCNGFRVTVDGVPTVPSANPEGSGLNSQYTGYGYAFEGNLGSNTRAGAMAALNDRLTQTCTNVKAAGVTVFTITFQLFDPAIQTLMRNCASDPDKFFNSPSNAELTAAFVAIGAELRSLHISK